MIEVVSTKQTVKLTFSNGLTQGYSSHYFLICLFFVLELNSIDISVTCLALIGNTCSGMRLETMELLLELATFLALILKEL